jgi:D-threo-aldose 1-dehydrogenase
MNVTTSCTLAEGRVRLTRLGLGGAPLAGLYEPVTETTARAVLQAAWDAGLRCFDTAPYYGHTLGERRFGAFLRECVRDEFVIITKVGRLLRPDAAVQPMENDWAQPLPFRPHYDYSYDGVMRSFDDSLQRLGLGHIDILLVHDIGRHTHGAAHETHWHALTRQGGFSALEELRRDGRIKAFGLGVNETDVVHASMQEARLDCTLLAGRYTLLEQRSLPLLAECQRNGNAIIVGGPFNSGLLAGQRKFDYADASATVLARAEALRKVCAEFGVPLPAAALEFPLAHPACAACVAGMRSTAELQQNVAWFEMPIPTALWQALCAQGLVADEAPCPADTRAGFDAPSQPSIPC